jgi:acyl-coenzyme A thioesterase PaaI-like protein
MNPIGDWAGSDFPDGSVALCGACRRLGACRLGLTKETLDDAGVVHSELRCPAGHEGGPGVAHGGWTAGVLDELLGHVPMLQGHLTVTGTLQIIFIRPVPLERSLIARTWVERREGQRWYISGLLQLASTGADLAKANGIFVERDWSHFERHQQWLADQDDAARTGTPSGHSL